jgi:hypothetical protein
MIGLLCLFFALLAAPFKSKSRLEAENAALRHQLIVLRRKVQGRVRLTNNDRWFFIQLYRWFPSILHVLTIIRPETLVHSHRAGFRRCTAHSRRTAQARVRDRTVKRCQVHGQAPWTDKPGWGTFLRNHAPDIAAMDLFVVPTIGFDLLYAFVIVRLDRRDLVWINVTANPTSEWIARQLTEAFPWDNAPRYQNRLPKGSKEVPKVPCECCRSASGTVVMRKRSHRVWSRTRHSLERSLWRRNDAAKPATSGRAAMAPRG